MNKPPARKFDAQPAVRTGIPLQIAIVSPSGGGKTYSALRLATGIQRAMPGDIILLDTENRRGLAYAETFKFLHMPFEPPFRSVDYLAALEQCAAMGARTVIVDSMSHEHNSIGGMIDYHEQELDRIAGDDWKKRERCSMLAWQRPKADRNLLLQGMTRLNLNLILLFRAKETSKPIKSAEGKIEIVPMGFMPIAGDEFVYEMAMSCLLLPRADGVPTWKSENPGERLAMKLPAQFRGFMPEGQPLDEDLGEKLAEWAVGSLDTILTAGRTIAEQGSEALKRWFAALPRGLKAAVKPTLDDELKQLAEKADKKPAKKGAAPAPVTSDDGYGESQFEDKPPEPEEEES